jgi:hypothetical protein
MVMKLRKAELPKDLREFIDSYRNKKIAEIGKIKVRWAYGENNKYLRYISVVSLRDYFVFLVKTRELIDKADFGEVARAAMRPDLLFNNVDERDFRVAKILDHWNKKGYLDPPEISTDIFGRIIFHDGRHRAVVAFHLGEEKIPVLVHKTIVKKVSDVLNLSGLS